MKLYRDEKQIQGITIIKDAPKVKVVNTPRIVIYSTMLGLSIFVGLHCLNFQKDNEEVDAISRYTTVSTINKNYKWFDIIPKNYAIDECKDACYYYSYAFNVNPMSVFEVIDKNLKNVSDIEFLKFGNILGTKDKYHSIDMQVVLLSDDISKNPSKYGYKREDVEFNIDIDSGLTIRQTVYKYADALGIDRTMALAIACAESGNFEESIATYNKNPYACKLPSGNYKIYRSLESGIAGGLLNLKRGYIDRGLDTYEKIEPIYCPNSNGHWTSIVKTHEKEIIQGKSLYDEYEINMAKNK